MALPAMIAVGVLGACGSSSESAAHYAGRAYAASTDLAAQLSSINRAPDPKGIALRCVKVVPQVEADMKVLDSAPDAVLRTRSATAGAAILQFLHDCGALDEAAVSRDLPQLRRAVNDVKARVNTLSGS